MLDVSAKTLEEGLGLSGITALNGAKDDAGADQGPPLERFSDDEVYAHLKAETFRLHKDYEAIIIAQADEERRHLLTRGRLEGVQHSLEDDRERLDKQKAEREAYLVAREIKNTKEEGGETSSG